MICGSDKGWPFARKAKKRTRFDAPLLRPPNDGVRDSNQSLSRSVCVFALTISFGSHPGSHPAPCRNRHKGNPRLARRVDTTKVAHRGGRFLVSMRRYLLDGPCRRHHPMMSRVRLRPTFFTDGSRRPRRTASPVPDCNLATCPPRPLPNRNILVAALGSTLLVGRRRRRADSRSCRRP